MIWEEKLLMIEHLMHFDFITKAIISGIGVAIIAGPLGSLMIWRRMAYFGDTLSHSTLLGVSSALLLNINVYLGLIGMCLIVSCFLASLTKQKQLASDAILAILSHATLALGLGMATVLEDVRIDLLGYLYGDILSVTNQDLIWIGIVTIVVLSLICLLWKWLLSVTVDESLAKVEGVPIGPVRWIFILIMSLFFAVTMKLIGVLLITALLIIPSSAARCISKNPEQMAVFASTIGSIAVVLGVGMSLFWDWPTGPAIVVMATTLFCVSLGLGKCIGLIKN